METIIKKKWEVPVLILENILNTEAKTYNSYETVTFGDVGPS